MILPWVQLSVNSSVAAKTKPERLPGIVVAKRPGDPVVTPEMVRELSKDDFD
jgi:hypothetical protein